MRIHSVRLGITKLRTQILLFALSLILVSTLVIQSISWWSANKFNQHQIQQNTIKAENILRQYIRSNENNLVNSARVLTADFGFKQAVASSDSDTIASVLANHGARIKADLMLLTDLSGQLISSSRSNHYDQTLLRQIVEDLMEKPGVAHIVMLNDRIYELILLPVMAPRTIAFSLLGFELNQTTLNELKHLTDLEITLLKNDQPVYSTLDSLDSDEDFAAKMNAMQSRWLGLQRPTFINSEVLPATSSVNPVSILLTTDLRPIYKQYDDLAKQLMLTVLLVVVAAIIISMIIAHKLTTPLARLVEIAHQFAKGNYDAWRDPGRSSSEVRDLTVAFRHMGEEIKQREQVVTWQARHDVLTGLFNIHTMRSTLTTIMRDYSQCIVVAMYIQNFRQINDRLGPEVADAFLNALATRLNQFKTSGNKTNARLEGIEFLSVIQLMPGQSPKQIVESLLDSLAQTFQISNISLTAQFYAGVCCYPADGTDSKTMLRRVRIAADHARINRTSIHVYTPGEDEEHLEELSIIEALQTLLKQPGNNELFLNFQPKVELSNGRIDTVETLIRWHRPGLGRIAPDKFIGLAEQSGLIVELSHWVIEQTLKQLAIWRDMGLHLKAAINVSAEDLAHPEFCRFLHSQFGLYNIPPDLVTIEITERDIMYDEALGIEVLKSLKKAGYKIAVDDYGIGQSSLSKLKILPVDELKLDMSFIRNLDTSHTDQKIVSSTIFLAHSLGLKVVAEGVENSASYELLTQMDCDSVQGYLISKPRDANDLVAWLGENNATYSVPADINTH
ncbi:MAG: diguanylate phosphodiesterase [Methylophaga sp.]|nr:diguanylate phosphodiesterase [Methylophaga sp.]MAY18580.1 diguanylate phosphodiesterase [Methylophaga sp.]MAY18956.1 diguanylate phosphodiesterase [Methylophaga sp.]MBN46346.1 diguanylate phosphodiesterase [Methylophaga sp.]